MKVDQISMKVNVGEPEKRVRSGQFCNQSHRPYVNKYQCVNNIETPESEQVKVYTTENDKLTVKKIENDTGDETSSVFVDN